MPLDEAPTLPPAPDRRKLPNRRQLERRALALDGQSFEVDIGFAVDGRPAEVFVAGGLTGSQLSQIAQDAATLISLALQHGIPPSRLAKSIARVPAIPTAALELGEVGQAATIIGAVLDLLARVEAEGPRLV